MYMLHVHVHVHMYAIHYSLHYAHNVPCGRIQCQRSWPTESLLSCYNQDYPGARLKVYYPNLGCPKVRPVDLVCYPIVCQSLCSVCVCVYTYIVCVCVCRERERERERERDQVNYAGSNTHTQPHPCMYQITPCTTWYMYMYTHTVNSSAEYNVTYCGTLADSTYMYMYMYIHCMSSTTTQVWWRQAGWCLCTPVYALSDSVQ